MTGREGDRIDTLRLEVHGQMSVLRTDLQAEIGSLRTEIAPAIEFYRTIVGLGRFLKWGVGLGASVVTIVAGLHMFDLW